jgi:hypothetical protein
VLVGIGGGVLARLLLPFGDPLAHGDGDALEHGVDVGEDVRCCDPLDAHADRLEALVAALRQRLVLALLVDDEREAEDMIATMWRVNL